MKNIKKSITNCIKKILAIFILFTIITYSLVNISKASSQQITEDINGIDTNQYPGIKEKIEQLKAQYPNWNFKILYTNLSWSDVISHEYQGHGSSPRNLIYNQANYQGNWICPICGDKPYDNGNWRCASESAIAYMMDPRNSLNSTDIFQFEELTATSADINIVKTMTNGTFLQGHEQGIVDIANKNGVNSYYIVARLIQEQGRNGSTLVSGKTGYYNAFNIGASGNTSSEIIANGLAYAQRKGWDTLEKSIDGGIGFVTDQYIKKGQNTLYLQKFNVTNDGTYWRQYQQNLMAAQKEGETLRNTYINTNSFNSSHTFIIPVYKNMPSQPVPRPDGSNRPSTTSDLVKVNVDSSLKIRRTPEDSTAIGWLWKDEIVTRLEKATTKINGTYWDKIRKSDGTEGYTARETFDYESKYKLYLVPVNEGQENGNTGNNGNTSGDSSNTPQKTVNVKINEEQKTVIVKPDTVVKDIINAFGDSAKIVKADGSSLENENTSIGTGYIINDKYTVVKKGDANGDAKIDTADLLAVQKHLLSINILQNDKFSSADANSDGKIDTADLLTIQKKLLNISDIQI